MVSIQASYLREQIDATGKLYHPNATVDDVDIIGYYGKYNGCYAVMIEDSFTVYGQAPWSETVNGITFYYGDGNRIYIWRAERELD